MTGKEISPADHPDKVVREVLKALRQAGWRLHREGHWGRLYCGCGCLTIPVSGTPRNAEQTARRIRWQARSCPLPEDDPRRRPGAARE